MKKYRKMYYFEMIDVVQFLIKWKRALIIISFTSAVASIICSGPWLIKPKFKSTAVFYPSTNNSVSSALLSDSKTSNKDPLQFGEQSAAQQFVQILESDYLKGRVIKHFNLLDNYQISIDDSEKNTKLIKKYNSNIAIKKTPFASIEINVLDENPETAANIANGIVSILDSVKREVQKRIADQALIIVEKQYRNKENEVTEIKMRMKEIGLKGVFSYEEQTKAIAEIASRGGNSENIKQQQANLAEYGSEALSLHETLVLELEKLSELRKKLEESRVDVESNLSNVFIISSATPAEKKSYPVRWLITVVSIFGSFIAGCVVLLFVDKFLFASIPSDN